MSGPIISVELATTALEIAGIAGAAGMATWAGYRPMPQLESAELRFDPRLDASQLEALLRFIAGLRRGSLVQLHVTATRVKSQPCISFAVAAPKSELAGIANTIDGLVPSAEVTTGEGADLDGFATPAGPPVLRQSIFVAGRYPQLRTDQPETSSAGLLSLLTSAVEGQDRGDGSVVRLILMLVAVGRVSPPTQPSSNQSPDPLSRLLLGQTAGGGQLTPATRTALGKKHSAPLLLAHHQLSVWTPHPAHAQELAGQIAASVRGRVAGRGQVRIRSMRPGPFELVGLQRQRPGARSGAMLSPDELVGLVGWPLGAPDISGVAYQQQPRLRLSPDIPGSTSRLTEGGRSFGVSTHPKHRSAGDRQLVQPTVGSHSHTLIVGPTGSGKSSLLTNLALQEAAAGKGLLLLDLKGDTATEFLERVDQPSVDGRRSKYQPAEILVFDPSHRSPGNSLRLPGLRPISGDPNLAADLWVSIFRGLFPDAWGLRSERYLRLALLTLARDRAATLADVPRVLVDEGFRRRLLSKGTPDPMLLSQWAALDSLSKGQAAEHLAPLLGKVGDLLSRPLIRGVLCQPAPKLGISQAIAQGRVIVVRLSPGQIGKPAAELLGALVVYEVYQAVTARQGLAKAKRLSFGIYIDEPAVLGSLPLPLDSLFEIARGSRVGLTLATQSLRRLPTSVQQAALSNAATIASFAAHAKDSALLAPELPGVSAEQLQHLGQFEIALRLGLKPGDIAPTATAKTRPLPAPTNDAWQLTEASAQVFGTDLRDIDEQLAERLGQQSEPKPGDQPPDDETPLGRRSTS